MGEWFANNKDHVGSMRVIDADLGVGNRRLIVASGIVIMNFRYDSDATWRGQERVWLGIFARDLEQSSAFVGLAAIANDESGYVFATDSARVELDQSSGELSLVVDDAVMGESSSLYRFGYQVVVTVVRVPAVITGTIRWPTTLFRPASDDPAIVRPMLGITANHDETVSFPDSFAFERLTPVAPGYIETLRVEPEWCTCTYRIADPPMAMPLKVTLTLGEGFGTGGVPLLGWQVSGPSIFTLTPMNPATVVDFEISAREVIQ